MSTLQVLDHRRVLPAELADDPARATRSSDKGPAPPPAGGRDVPGGFRRFVWTASRLSPVLAISAAALTVVLYLGDWPYGGNRALQLLFAFGLGARDELDAPDERGVLLMREWHSSFDHPSSVSTFIVDINCC